MKSNPFYKLFCKEGKDDIMARVEITKNGKIRGWLKVSEAAWVCGVSTSKMRKYAKDFLKNDKFELYGTLFLRGTKVDKLAKKIEKEQKANEK